MGEWKSEEGNVIVEVFKKDNEYRAKVLWFDDSDDPSKHMQIRTDENNPDPKLRKRKIIGLEVLNGLIYNSKSRRWENGDIYDTRTGKKWRSIAHLTGKGLLKVKGFWRFEFIGRSATFRKIG